MDVEQLFVESCRHLDRLLADRSPYALLKASAELRLLLIDKAPLVHQVNKAYGLTLSFQVVHGPDWDAVLGKLKEDGVDIPRPDMEILGAIVDEEVPSLRRATVTSVDRFLKHAFARVRDQRFSIQDAIQFLANVRGGVHVGKPDSDQAGLVDLQGMYRDISAFFGIPQVDALFPAIYGIGVAALRGLAPLVDAVVARRSGPTKAMLVLSFGPNPGDKAGFHVEFTIDHATGRWKGCCPVLDVTVEGDTEDEVKKNLEQMILKTGRREQSDV